MLSRSDCLRPAYGVMAWDVCYSSDVSVLDLACVLGIVVFDGGNAFMRMTNERT